jgi:hypothetical protein
MWPRVGEVALGCWLLLTPFVFRGTAAIENHALNAATTGFIVILASLLSFWDRTRFAHIVTLFGSLWLAAHGYFWADRPGPPGAQNELIVGLLLLLFAILPNEINDVPRPWRGQASDAER